MSEYSRYPARGTPIIEYTNATFFPVVANNGDLALALDSYILYVFESGTMSWVPLASPGDVTAITGLIGDGTANGPGVVPLTLATVNSNVGTFGTASSVSTITVNGKGLITAVNNTPISIPGSQITGFTQGSIPFGNVSGGLTQDNSKLYWDDTNFSLGIGLIPASNISLDILNTNGTSKAIQSTAYGVGSSIPFRGRFARGTVVSPAAAQSGDNLSTLSGRGYGTSQFATTSTGAINIVASETFTDTSNATLLQFEVTPTGSVTLAEAMRLNSTGNLLIGTTTDSGTQKLQVNGNSNVGIVTQGTWNGTVTAGIAIIASGTTYTTPANITTATLFHFTVIGAGGGGGGVNSANVGAVGGGGGCVGHVWLTGLSPSTAYTYSIGAGGAGGANTSSTAGSTGGATAITINSVTYTAGAGGGAAAISGNTNGPAGGLGINFQIELIGGNGGASTNTLAGLPSGKGGDACGWGIGGSPICAAGNGINGRGFGGGGSGAHGTGAGGSGSQGGIIVEWSN